MLLENHFELVALLGGCGYAGLTLFGVNTGLRGEILAGVVNQSRRASWSSTSASCPEVERVRGQLKHVARENILVLLTGTGATAKATGACTAAVASEVGRRRPAARRCRRVDVDPMANLMVIYTSGTTGLPKGINNNHTKLCATGFGVSTQLGLGQDDVGYACMPLFHSNSMFVGFMPALLGRRRHRACASASAPASSCPTCCATA